MRHCGLSDKTHSAGVKIKFGVMEKESDGPKCAMDMLSKPKVRYPTICLSGKHKALFDQAVGKVPVGDEVTITCTFRKTGDHVSEVENKDPNDWDNRTDLDLISVEGQKVAPSNEPATVDGTENDEPDDQPDPAMENTEVAAGY